MALDLSAFAREHGVRLLVQFGSTVSGAIHPRSDLDLGVLLEHVPRSLVEYGALTARLQELFPEREIDLAVLNHADPLFLKQVLDRCRLLFGSPRLLADLRLYAFKRFVDHRRFLAMERAYVRRMAGRAAS